MKAIMKKIPRLTGLLIFYFFICGSGLNAQTVTITPDKPSGLYDVGQTVTWEVQVNPDSDLQDIRYRIMKGELLDKGHGDLSLTNYQAKLQ